MLPIRTALHAGPLFSALDEDALKSLAGRALTRSFPKNTVLITAGDRSDSLYIIISGRVKIYVSDEQGRKIVLGTQGPGEYFGEMVLDEGTRSASVMTLEPSNFVVI